MFHHNHIHYKNYYQYNIFPCYINTSNNRIRRYIDQFLYHKIVIINYLHYMHLYINFHQYKLERFYYIKILYTNINICMFVFLYLNIIIIHHFYLWLIYSYFNKNNNIYCQHIDKNNIGIKKHNIHLFNHNFFTILHIYF